ncbi:MAG: galactitol-1-phosphate 5-dehydrogenase [Clostridia bacterium]|nr:galactitol-1-phosphate 5-dehydrogenase [Clostridia bacterium]
MKACVLHGVGDLRFEERRLPPLQPGEATMKIKAAGICGSDIPRVFDKGTYHFPTIPGHEFAGEIVEVAEADNLRLVGTRASVFPLLPCFRCGPCTAGQFAQCEAYDYYGSRRDGAFAEYLNVKVWNLVAVPEHVSYELAAMCEPAAVAMHALEMGHPHYGDNVVISGAGTIGLILAQLAAGSGAEHVILMDVDPQKLDYARKLGFADVVNTMEADASDAVKQITGGRMSQVSIEGSGAAASLRNCVRVTGNFGRVVLMGNPLGDMDMDQKTYWEILRRQLSVAGAWNSSFNGRRNHWERAIAAIASGKLNLEPLITHRLPLDGCNAAFTMLHNHTDFALKVMFIND